MRPLTSKYILTGYESDFMLNVLPKGQALRFSIEHKKEGTIKLTENEGSELMRALMHYFNIKVPG